MLNGGGRQAQTIMRVSWTGLWTLNLGVPVPLLKDGKQQVALMLRKLVTR